MARGINKAIIVGTLGNDPDVRHSQGGSTITKISVATNEQWKDKNGDKNERTEWHRITFFGKLAEIAGEYLKKGSQVYIEGRIQTSKYQAQDGTDRYSTEIVANEMQMLGERSEPSRPAQSAERPAQSAPVSGGAVIDDDIPFAQYDRGQIA